MANEKDKKISGVGKTTGPGSIEKMQGVHGIDPVKRTESIGAVQGVSGIGQRRPTRKMTLAEREQLFKYINEEADKMLKEGSIPESQRELVTEAVKMAIDSGLVEEKENKGK
jgi:hypothetical protein